MRLFNKILSILIVWQILTASVVFAAADVSAEKQPDKQADLNMQEVTLPSEIKEIGKQGGAIFYDTYTKNKPLIATHLWGEIGRPGLHFIPTDTPLIRALSMAGGPTGLAKLEEILVTRITPEGKMKHYEFDLSAGGDLSAHNFKLETGDSVFLRKDTFSENRAYYTSLVGIVLSLITTFFIVTKVK